MRIFRSAIAVLAVLGLATLSDFARGAGGPSANNVVPAETLVDVHAKSMKGASFIAPETGAYSFTIVSGALSYVSPKEVAISPYGGWFTCVQIYTKPVVWGPANKWGQHPLNPTASVGDNKHQPTIAEAEAAGKGSTITLTLQKGARVTLLVSDGSKYYGDNQGYVTVRIATDLTSSTPSTPPSPATPAAPVTPATPAPVAPVAPATPHGPLADEPYE